VVIPRIWSLNLTYDHNLLLSFTTAESCGENSTPPSAKGPRCIVATTVCIEGTNSETYLSQWVLEKVVTTFMAAVGATICHCPKAVWYHVTMPSNCWRPCDPGKKPMTMALWWPLLGLIWCSVVQHIQYLQLLWMWKHSSLPVRSGRAGWCSQYGWSPYCPVGRSWGRPKDSLEVCPT